MMLYVLYLEVVAGRAGQEADPAGGQADLAGEVRGAAARVGVGALLARELAQRAAVGLRRDAGAAGRAGRQVAHRHVPRATYRLAALAVLAQLRACTGSYVQY